VERSDVNRREALRTLAAGAVGAAAAPLWVESLTAFAHQQARAHAHAAQAARVQAWTPRVLTAPQNDLVIALTELIIPQTETPGAKAALVNRFIDGVLAEAKTADRDAFLRGLAWIDERSRARHAKAFTAASASEQESLLATLASEANNTPDDRPGVEFFRAIKSMTISGYYTSEIGLQEELGDDATMFLPEFPGCTHPEHQG
jgi:hypothetical protein